MPLGWAQGPNFQTQKKKKSSLYFYLYILYFAGGNITCCSIVSLLVCNGHGHDNDERQQEVNLLNKENMLKKALGGVALKQGEPVGAIIA